MFIIAEAGVNHNGDRDIAFQLIDAAVDSGADAIKFQTFLAKNLVVKGAAKANYQLKVTNPDESQFEMLSRLELPFDLHFELLDYCNKKGIQFLSTAFDEESFNFLKNELGFHKYKISSGDITNAPLLLLHARTRSELIVSTGMSTLGEIENALSVIAFGLIQGDKDNIQPSRQAFKAAYSSLEGQTLLKEKVTLLHCTTEYPAPMHDINLKAIRTLRKAFNLRIGYSDHSEGISIPIEAVAMGAALIEKHFTVDKFLSGPDHCASLDPNELKSMVSAIRSVSLAMGDGVKYPRESELKNLNIARKSICAVTDINKGDAFTENNITVKRPGNGNSPMNYWDLIGKISKNNYSEHELIFE